MLNKIIDRFYIDFDEIIFTNWLEDKKELHVHFKGQLSNPLYLSETDADIFFIALSNYLGENLQCQTK